MTEPSETREDDAQRTVEFLRELFRGDPEAVVITDVRQDVVMASDAFCALIEQDREAVVGQALPALLERLADDAPHRWAELEQQTRREGHGCEIEIQLATARGERLMSVNTSFLESPAAPQGGIVTSTWRDVTAWRDVENELRESEQRFRSIVEASPMGIYLYQLEASGRLVLIGANAMADRMTDSKTSELLGKTIEEAFPALVGTGIPNDYRRAAREGGQLHWPDVPYDEGEIHGSFDVHAFQSSPGRVVVMFLDITQRKQVEEDRRKLDAQVQHAQKLESLGVLAGGIAHDFNNLLLAILGNADLALMDISPVSPVRDNVQEIRKASQRAADLARQMLAYSGKGRFIIQPLDISEVVREMTHMLDVSISKKAVLKYNFSKDLPTVEADATQMRQVIMNLITNASEAIGDRSGIISITTGAMDVDRRYLEKTYFDEDLPNGLYVTLEVADTGCGMDAETKAKIFDPFFTTKFTGRGLGMAAVLGIIRGHKGAVKVYSEVGKGTSLKILLPAATATQAQPALPEQFPALNDWKGEGTVLLVDDEETVRAIGKTMLTKLGFDVILADDGRHALEMFEAHGEKIDVVILDLTMPHMDGEETFRELRRRKPDIRVIMSSGYNEQEVVQRFLVKRIAGFIQKPYGLEVLAGALKTALGE